MSRQEINLGINPKNVKWKFFYAGFYAGDDGKIMCCQKTDQIAKVSDSEQERNKVAMLTTSLFFGAKNPAEKMKTVTEAALKYEGRLSQFCVALPFSGELAEEAPHEATAADYAGVAMHDIYNEKSFIGYQSPKVGVEQIASAIKQGFHINSMAGGVSLGQKLELLRQYFRENPLPADHKKPIIAAFSDGSEFQFATAEFAEFFHAGCAGVTYSRNPAFFHKQTEIESVKQMIAAFEAQDDYPIQRTLKCEDDQNFAEIKKRYEAAKKPIRCFTYFPRQLISAIDSPYRPRTSEPLILCLEGYLQSERGYNACEALETALSQGVFTAEQIIAINIENLIAKEEELKIQRIDGHIPSYEELSEGDQGVIVGILHDSNPTHKIKEKPAAELEILVREYINRSNHSYDLEVLRIKAVAAKFGIPVIMGGEVRAGHAYNFVSQPCCVKEMAFDDKSGEVILTSLVRKNQLVEVVAEKISPKAIEKKVWMDLGTPDLGEEDSIVYLEKEAAAVGEYSKESGAHQVASESLQKRMSALKIVPANEATQALLQRPSSSHDLEFVGGLAGNLSEENLGALNGKGLLCILPTRQVGKGVHQSFDIIKLINSGRIGSSDVTDEVQGYQIPFVILASQNAEYQNTALSHAIKNLHPDVPIFLAASEIGDLSEFSTQFTGRLNLQQMTTPNLVIKAGSATTTTSTKAASLA